MNLDDVMDEAAAVIDQITGLRVTAWPPRSVVPPAGYVSYPQSIDFDETYRRARDKFTGLPITLLAGKATERSARDKAAEWSAGSGSKSVKALAEAHAWTSCDTFTITSVSFDVEELAGVPYLAVVFTADVYGEGA